MQKAACAEQLRQTGRWMLWVVALVSFGIIREVPLVERIGRVRGLLIVSYWVTGKKLLGPHIRRRHLAFQGI